MLIVFMKMIDVLIETCCLGYKIVPISQIVYKLHTFLYLVKDAVMHRCLISTA